MSEATAGPWPSKSTSTSGPSRGRLLLELGKRFGTTALDSVEASLYAAYLLDGGDWTDDEEWESWIDRLDDPGAVIAQVAETLAEDPTPPPTGG